MARTYATLGQSGNQLTQSAGLFFNFYRAKFHRVESAMNSQIFLENPMSKSNGSFVSTDTPGNHVVMAQFLTTDGIMARHKLRRNEFEKIRRELADKKLSDILFSYPDGPRYDIVLYMVATAR